eukprot:5566306-Amphidinium_carterae.1
MNSTKVEITGDQNNPALTKMASLYTADVNMSAFARGAAKIHKACDSGTISTLITALLMFGALTPTGLVSVPAAENYEPNEAQALRDLNVGSSE